MWCSQYDVETLGVDFSRVQWIKYKTLWNSSKNRDTLHLARSRKAGLQTIVNEKQWELTLRNSMEKSIVHIKQFFESRIYDANDDVASSFAKYCFDYILNEEAYYIDSIRNYSTQAEADAVAFRNLLSRNMALSLRLIAFLKYFHKNIFRKRIEIKFTGTRFADSNLNDSTVNSIRARPSDLLFNLPDIERLFEDLQAIFQPLVGLKIIGGFKQIELEIKLVSKLHYFLQNFIEVNNATLVELYSNYLEDNTKKTSVETSIKESLINDINDPNRKIALGRRDKLQRIVDAALMESFMNATQDDLLALPTNSVALPTILTGLPAELGANPRSSMESSSRSIMSDSMRRSTTSTQMTSDTYQSTSSHVNVPGNSKFQYFSAFSHEGNCLSGNFLSSGGEKPPDYLLKQVPKFQYSPNNPKHAPAPLLESMGEFHHYSQPEPNTIITTKIDLSTGFEDNGNMTKMSIWLREKQFDVLATEGNRMLRASTNLPHNERRNMMYDSIDEKLNSNVLKRITQMEQDLVNDILEKKRQVLMKREEERKKIERALKAKEIKLKEQQAKLQRQEESKTKQLSEDIAGEYEDEEVLGKPENELHEEDEDKVDENVSVTLQMLAQSCTMSFLARISESMQTEKIFRTISYFKKPKKVMQCMWTFPEGRRFYEDRYHPGLNAMRRWQVEVIQKQIEVLTVKEKTASQKKKQHILNISFIDFAIDNLPVSPNSITKQPNSPTRDSSDSQNRLTRSPQKRPKILCLGRSALVTCKAKKSQTYLSRLFNKTT